eukprot:g10540.t1
MRHWQQALKLFEVMSKVKVHPSVISYSAAITDVALPCIHCPPAQLHHQSSPTPAPRNCYGRDRRGTMLLPQSRNHEEGEFVQGSAWACFGLLVLTIHQWSSADKDPSRPGGQVREELQKRAQKGTDAYGPALRCHALELAHWGAPLLLADESASSRKRRRLAVTDEAVHRMRAAYAQLWTPHVAEDGHGGGEGSGGQGRAVGLECSFSGVYRDVWSNWPVEVLVKELLKQCHTAAAAMDQQTPAAALEEAALAAAPPGAGQGVYAAELLRDLRVDSASEKTRALDAATQRCLRRVSGTQIQDAAQLLASVFEQRKE